MKRTTALLCACVLTLLGAMSHATPLDSGVTTSGEKVTISSKGEDVRSVLYELFRQTDKNFVLDAGVRYVLYLHLEDVSFQEALEIVMKNAEISYEVKNGIYYIGRNRKPSPADTKPTTKPESKPQAKPEHKPATPGEHKPEAKPEAKPNPKPESNPAGRLTTTDLNKRLTTRLSMTDIRKVFEEFSKQTGVKLEVAENVPNYKLDAFLIDTSLKYALDVVCDAAKLKWTLTEFKTIKIEKAD